MKVVNSFNLLIFKLLYFILIRAIFLSIKYHPSLKRKWT